MEGAVPALLTTILATAVAVLVARLIALAKNRGPSVWMWVVALFPPALLVVALPHRRPHLAGAST